jgi:hypothetical protein
LAQSPASLVAPGENEPAPRLFVEPPLSGPLATGVAFIPVSLPRGEHRVLIEAVDPEGRVLTAQTVTFKSPGKSPGKQARLRQLGVDQP